MCTHRGERFLKPQLASIAGQTAPCQALEIHDWGSTDETHTMLADFQQQHADSLPTQITSHDFAPGPARSFLAALDQTLRSRQDFDYLMFSDQDDIWLPHKLASFRGAIGRADRPDLIYSDVSLIDAEGRTIREAMLGRPIDLHHPATLVLNLVPGMAMAVSRRFLDRWADLWTLPGWLMHDFAMCIAAYLTGATTHQIPDSLTAYRQHSGGFTAAAGSAGVFIRPIEMLRRARRYVRGVHTQFDGPVRTAARTLGATHLLPSLDRRTIDHLIIESSALSPKAMIPSRAAFQLFSPLY
jgi:rhamnosyltransferase